MIGGIELGVIAFGYIKVKSVSGVVLTRVVSCVKAVLNLVLISLDAVVISVENRENKLLIFVLMIFEFSLKFCIPMKY